MIEIAILGMVMIRMCRESAGSGFDGNYPTFESCTSRGELPYWDYVDIESRGVKRESA